MPAEITPQIRVFTACPNLYQLAVVQNGEIPVQHNPLRPELAAQMRKP